MDTMGKYVIFLIVWWSCIPLAAQEPVQMEFVEVVYDFGLLEEDAGARSHEFIFFNKGREPLLVHGVTTTCGCTVAAFPHEPILPGRQGKIVLTYHPKGRPGRFDREALVKSNAVNSDALLRIVGVVAPGKGEKHPGYRSEIGALKLKSRMVRLGKVYKGRPYEQRIVVANCGQEPLGVDFEEVPSHLQVRLEPHTLLPDQTGEIVIDYRAALCGDWGMREDGFYIRPSGYGVPSGEENRFVVCADLWDDVDQRPQDQKKDAPEVAVYPLVLNLVAEDGNGILKRTIRLTNRGGSGLVVRKVYCPSPSFSFVLPGKKAVPPQQGVEIGVQVDVAGLPEGFSETELYISTDDPSRQTVKIPVKMTGK